MKILTYILTMTVATICVLAFGCIKAPSEKPPELGPEVSSGELEEAISKATYGVDPRKVAVNQEAYYQFTARLESQETVRLTGDLRQTVIGRYEDEKVLRLTVRNIERQVGVDGEKPTEETIVFEKAPQPTDAISAFDHAQAFNFNDATKKIFARIIQATDLHASRSIVRHSYHRLIVETGERPPPDSVMARPNCGDVPNCSLPYTQLQFDDALWYNDTDFEVQRHRYVVSKATPWLGLIMEHCLDHFVLVEGTRYYIRQCQFLQDFKYN